MLPCTDPLKYDVVEFGTQILAVLEQASGKMGVCPTILKDGRRIVKVTSQFLYRDTYTDYENTFQLKIETPMQVRLAFF